MNLVGRVRFSSASLYEISLDLTTHMPDLTQRPLRIELYINGAKLCAFSLANYGWLELRVPVPEELSESANGSFEMELRADRTWQPRPVSDETRDDRDLSIAVCNIVIKSRVWSLESGV